MRSLRPADNERFFMPIEVDQKKRVEQKQGLCEKLSITPDLCYDRNCADFQEQFEGLYNHLLKLIHEAHQEAHCPAFPAFISKLAESHCTDLMFGEIKKYLEDIMVYLDKENNDKS